MLSNKRHYFDIPEEISYLNNASMSPLMKNLADLGNKAINLRLKPYNITGEDWFLPTENLKKNFAKLINCPDHNRIAMIPSVSYGIATIAKNIKLNPKDEIIVIGEQFPSNYYSWLNLAQQQDAILKTIPSPTADKNKGKIWNERILDAISNKTKIIALGNIHWTNGIIFDLEAISKRAKELNAFLIIDGSQSIGALAFDIDKIKPDAVICTGYKWLMGPYSCGLAYYGPRFDNGSPLEENWINRENSDNFQGLADYTAAYRPLAGRYNVGESSNFHLVPIMNGAIEQLLEWGVDHIQNYCQQLIEGPIDKLRDLGCLIADQNQRANHLFGIAFHKNVDIKKLQKRFLDEKIYLSLRGKSVRVSVNVYNTKENMERLVDCIEQCI